MHLVHRSSPPQTLIQNQKKWTQEWVDYMSLSRKERGTVEKPPARWILPEISNALSIDFENSCGYCGIEINSRTRKGKNFPGGHIDNFLPKSISPELVCEWSNLIWCCLACTQQKGAFYDKEYPLFNPCNQEDMEVLEVDDNGRYRLKKDFSEDKTWQKRFVNTDKYTFINADIYTTRRSLIQKQLTLSLKQLKSFDRLIQNPLEKNSSEGALFLFEKLQEEAIRDFDSLFQNSDFIRMKRVVLSKTLDADPDLAKYLRKLGLGVENINSELVDLPIRITRLELKNFRGFRHLILNFGNQQTSILKGENGKGKSTVMEALSLLCSLWGYKIPESDFNQLGPSLKDIHQEEENCSCHLNLNLGDQKFCWSVSREKKESSSSSKGEIFSTVQRIRSMMKRNPDANIPLIVYYPVHRLVKTPDVSFPKEDEFSLGHQYEAYSEAFEGKTDFKELFRWFRIAEEIEREEKRENPLANPLPQLEIVRKAIKRILPEFSDLAIQRNPNQDRNSKLVVKKGGVKLELDQLSEGEKIALGMVGDLARRLTIANPILEDPLKGHGIVLIDEVDLHLHPQWQSRIVVLLEELFPNCQLIVSTHSPIVLSYVSDAQVFPLSLDSETPELEAVQLYGKDAGHIVEDDMGVTLRDEIVQAKLDSLYKVIQKREKELYQSLIKELRGILSVNDPALVKAEVAAHRMGIT